MRINKLFTFGLAALAFAACSNDDEPGAGANGEKGELVDAISIKFVESGTATRNTNGDATQDGVGDENNVYVAYVFAREAAPLHAGAMDGDWTVKRVIANPVADKDKTDDKVTTPITSKAGTDAEAPSQGAMATFAGVQMGDNVYVIVNDPKMDLNKAETMAHKGAATEAAIKAYVSKVDKETLNALTTKDAAKPDDTGKKRFIMAGVASIPTNPNTPNGQTVKVPVELNRELAKVKFTTTVTTDAQYEAYKKVKLQAGDGLIVVRIPREVSFFTEQARDWYYPKAYAADTEDWTTDWTDAFDGQNFTAKASAEAIDAGFNTLAPALATAKEYRLTWAAPADDATVDAKTKNLLVRDAKGTGTLASPFFYVTPNYSAYAGCATVICTQATYVGAPAFKDANAQAIFTGCYNLYAGATGNETLFKKDGEIIPFLDLEWTDDHMAAAETYLINVDDNLIAIKAAVAKFATPIADADVTAAITEKITGVKTATAANDNLAFFTGMKRFYRVDVANYADDNATSKLITERNTFYQTKGTITTLGAPSISDAINTNNIGMIVEVKVMPWKWLVNDVNM